MGNYVINILLAAFLTWRRYSEASRRPRRSKPIGVTTSTVVVDTICRFHTWWDSKQARWLFAGYHIIHYTWTLPSTAYGTIFEKSDVVFIQIANFSDSLNRRGAWKMNRSEIRRQFAKYSFCWVPDDHDVHFNLPGKNWWYESQIQILTGKDKKDTLEEICNKIHSL